MVKCKFHKPGKFLGKNQIIVGDVPFLSFGKSGDQNINWNEENLKNVVITVE